MLRGMRLPGFHAVMCSVLLCAACVDSSGDETTRPDGGGTGETPPPADRPRFEYFIRGDTYPRLVMEIDAVPGQTTRASVRRDLADGLRPLLDKPEGIEFIVDQALESRGGDHAWTFEELDLLARETFDLAVPKGTLKMHTLLVDGRYQSPGGGTVLGIAWAHTHLVLFTQTIAESCNVGIGPLAEQVCTDAERGIWAHEIGHLLGLVDNGLAMSTPHREPDAAKGAHDQSDRCIMYWAYEGTGIIDAVSTGLFGSTTENLGFDAACLADLAAVRER